MPAKTQIGFAHLQVSNLARSLVLYRDLLGFQVISQPPGSAKPKTASLSASGKAPAQLILTEHPGAVRKPPRTTGLYHVAIRYPHRIALARAFKRMLDHEWAFFGAADHLVSEALYLPDPDGLGLEMYADRPTDTWLRKDGQIQMASDPLDLDSLLAAAAEDPTAWDAVPAGTDIGHIHLQVSDLEEGEQFYARTLGFDVTQRSYTGALFVSAGGYHHHLGMNIWSGRGAPPPPPDAVGLLSFSLSLPDDAARQELRSRLESNGVAVRDSEHGPLFYSNEGVGVVIA